ncbi:TonB-dependent receptor [Acidobacteria bacterium AB60]|nr:TonB-dependent receptor [Acidobacteria bacterium AB60]
MRLSMRIIFWLFVLSVSKEFSLLHAQSGNAGTISGTVSDPSGALVLNAGVEILNPISQYSRTVITDKTGKFTFPNVPFNSYHLTVNAPGFAPLVEDVDVRSSVPVNLTLGLKVTASQTVTVESNAGDLVESDPTFHVDVDRDLFIKVPLESVSSTLSALVTQTTPGVAADSNGLFHGIGDHASNSFSVDGQSITDQQSKIFSNQLPSNAVQSIEVIDGAPPAEFGGKTSLVIIATTRSGQGMTHPTGSITGSYGTFGSATGSFDLGYGGKNWGNFLEVDGLNTGRFLDPPEFSVFHDKGNEENFFDRIDYSLSPSDSVHLNLNYSRSWFQNPNTYDNLDVRNVVSGGTSASPVFDNVGNADQRSQIQTFNITPTWTHIVSDEAVTNVILWARKDFYHYYPSGNPLADLGPIQTASISQYRTLFDVGGTANLTWTHGHHNVKAGVEYDTTFLREHDNLGVVSSTYSFTAPCADANGNPVPGYSDPSQCTGDLMPNSGYDPDIAAHDLTRGGSFYHFTGHADIKGTGLYVQDQMKFGNWTANVGMRGDLYNGLVVTRQPEPRAGIAYNIKPSATVLSLSYARTLETPFNENLIVSSQGCSDAVLNPLLNCTPGVQGTVQPGFRNEFHASLQQAFGKHLVFGGEYIWKYTRNAFDFSILGNTPIFFPIDWHNGKIPGYALHVEVPEFRHFSAYTVMSSVQARFFNPQVAGAGATVATPGAVDVPFRIDHDEKFNQTTHFQYTVAHAKYINGIWSGFNWRYDSGLVAGAMPCYNVIGDNTRCGGTSITLPNGQPGVDLSGLSPDQQFEAGIVCDGVAATPTTGFANCDNTGYKSSLVSIPAPNTEDDDKRPPRIAPRSLFDVTVGKTNIFHTDHYKTDLDFTAINVTNKYALYNFLSTFSGTHYVTPRALTAKVTLNF